MNIKTGLEVNGMDNKGMVNNFKNKSLCFNNSYN